MNHILSALSSNAPAASNGAADQMPSYSCLLEAYQRERTLNSMFQRLINPHVANSLHSQSNLSSGSNMHALASFQNETALKAHLQAMMPSSRAPTPSTNDTILAFLQGNNTNNSKQHANFDVADSAILKAALQSSSVPAIDPALLAFLTKQQLLQQHQQSFVNPAAKTIAHPALLSLMKQSEQSSAKTSATPTITNTVGDADSISTTASSLALKGADMTASSVLTGTQAPTGSPSKIMDYQPEDVLFGKGRTKHGGNRNLQNLIESLMNVYESATKQQKKELADMVVSKIFTTGARFLKQDEETQLWEEVKKDEAHKKVAHAFRNLRRRSK